MSADEYGDKRARLRFVVDDDITLWVSHEVLDGLAPGAAELVFAFSGYGRFRLQIK